MQNWVFVINHHIPMNRVLG